jgi:aminoglycoside phosphotransferase family enzyme/predicted kinase
MAQSFLKSLLKPHAYPEPTANVQLLQTHISFLFITDNFVYKIKKPVDFGFLNFTTLDRRRFYCGEEVRLNSRLSPEIYLGVVELRESPEGPIFGGNGKVIDYAVKMKRLPEERMLHRLLADGLVGENELKRIAATIGEFHRTAARGEDIDNYGSIPSIKRNWDENFQQIAEFINLTISKNDLSYITMWVENFIANNEELLNRRVTDGFIRECDGDLHLENICLTDKVYIFDCIEFNRRFSCSDTAADIAFLLMDLDFQCRQDLSAMLANEYMAVTGDAVLPLLVDFYKIYRAVVRGKVESFRLNDYNIPLDEKMAARERATRYFRLARGYILRQKLNPTLIITCGLMGSGKSSIANALSFELGLETATADAVRKNIAGVPLQQHREYGYGQGIYTPAWNSATYGKLLNLAENALCNNQSIIIDATFRRSEDRNVFRSLAKRLHAKFYIIETSCSEKSIKDRLAARRSQPCEISDGKWALFAMQKNEFEPVSEADGNLISINTDLPLLDNINTIITRMELS